MSSTADFRAVIILTTLPAAADAGALARTLVAERLAACVNALPPMSSTYRWKGSVDHDEERQFVIKTAAALVPRVEARLKELHPYELPEFLVIDATGSAAYLAWIRESVG